MSAIEPLNPFEGQRWEQDSQHIIYLPENLIISLEKRQDIYLVGSRGTGKTTFLRALNWKTRLENRSIRYQVREEDLFVKKYIGIYINTMSFGDSIFERDNAKDDTSLMLLYSLWAEVNVLYRIVEAIESLYEKNHIDFEIKAEQLQCNKVYDYLSNLFGDIFLENKINTNSEYNITLLKEVLSELRKKTIDEKENLKHRCDSYSYGDLIEKTVPNLVSLCDKDNTNKWCTKICFDAVESAPNFHKIINTLVGKKLSDRVWFIISGLTHRDIDMYQTYIPNHNLTNDDKLHIDLDEIFFLTDKAKRSAFNSFAQGICDLRLKHSDLMLQNSKNLINSGKEFDLSQHLGVWDMNEILNVFLKRKKSLSVNKHFADFMKSVQENKETDKYLTDFPPYIETYYYDILKNDQKWKGDLLKSRQKNSATGKKYIVITLALLREYSLSNSTPYVGHRQIISLCSSTRDFLKIMEALFNVRLGKKSCKNLSDFFSYKAELNLSEIEAQTEAVVRVANDKYGGIKKKYGRGKATERMSVFIDTCGTILFDLQAKRELSSLMSEEKRIFTTSFKDDKKRRLYKFLQAAADDTYIKILRETIANGLIKVDFELARLFAPRYKSSFRQTQVKIIMDGEILKELSDCEADSCDQISKKLINSIECRYKTAKEPLNDPTDLEDKQKTRPKTKQKTLF